MSNSSSDKIYRVALVAHDAQKSRLVDWVGENQDVFAKAAIFSTGTTGGLLLNSYPDLDVTPLKSGPLGGDQQIGALICEEKLDALIFFTDPLSPMPHDVDVKALTRLATVYDLPSACSPSTANLIVRAMRDSSL
ncbi:methylglyoxal synthase [Shimia thalassica]|uniref:methylglyoxal synthase n=1 Tax=Shimia thalassica TaxID=1715693 RepID=UPI0026E4446B|nr:methylglyoxal synthase [Shimia thalassica]MDO6485739.1 methylglyoxal synthase [Shimia thalassica]